MLKQVVIGLGFGDEGKGVVTDWLCSQNPETKSLVRYCSGHQVGHTVTIENDKHIFSNFGSGTFRGVPTIWNADTVDPMGLVNEYRSIEKYNPKIKIHPMCPVTTPLDKAYNLHREKDVNHSTIGVGFGATIEREENNYHLYFQDLYYDDILLYKLKAIEKYYKEKGIEVSDDIIKNFIGYCKESLLIVDNSLEVSGDIVYESGQGLLLDMDYGIFPYVTRSQVGTQRLDVNDNTEYYLVTRAYQTRHGNGPVSEYFYSPNNKKDETNKDNKYQGLFKTRVLDLDMLHYSMEIDSNIRESKNKSLIITCLDQMTSYDFIFKGQVFTFKSEKAFLDSLIHVLPKVKNVYISHGPTAKDVELYKV